MVRYSDGGMEAWASLNGNFSPRRRTLASTELSIPVQFSAYQVPKGGFHAKTRRSKSVKEIITIREA